MGVSQEFNKFAAPIWPAYDEVSQQAFVLYSSISQENEGF